MADVSAQVGDGLLRRLAVEQAGVEHVPAGGQVVAGKKVQHLHQLFGVAQDPAALQQQDHAGLLRQGHKGLQPPGDVAVRVRVQQHIGDQEIAGRLNSGGDLVLRLGGQQVRLHPHAGDGQILAHQLAAGRHGQLRVGGAVPAGQEAVADAVDLQAVETGVHGGGAEAGPVPVRPMTDGIRELHFYASSYMILFRALI